MNEHQAEQTLGYLFDISAKLDELDQLGSAVNVLMDLESRLRTIETAVERIQRKV